MTEIETHPFEPFIPLHATVLIVGSFPGKAQSRDTDAANQWFYGAKRNQFWTILSAVYDTELKTAKAKQQLFSDKGIGITDIFLKVRRKENSNLDTNLEVIEYNDKAIRAILEAQQFAAVFFTSRFVEKHFMKLFPATVNASSLPSPSPRYARMTKADKIAAYKEKLPA
jgi:hypoxanthine-DNA glycosylase